VEAVTSVAGVTARGVTICFVLALAAVACSDDDPQTASTTSRFEATATTSTTTTAPERPASTTTTAFDPASVEGAVEAAYLKSWDVYADAVYDLELDEQALAAVYAEEHLETKRAEIERRIAEGDAALVRIEHDYTIEVVDSSTAIVIDRYQNHQVLIDPETKDPTEPDPDELVVDAITLRLISGTWKVTYLEGLQ
jgi:hypothetical protein